MITIRVTRPVLYRSERQEVGMRLDVPALEAADLLGSGRAELISPSDATAVSEALQQHARKLAPRERTFR